MLRAGDLAPPFRGRDQHGREVSLESLLADGPVVLYFYPKAFTSVCTRQARLFEDARPELAEFGAHIVGVSVDDEHTARDFAEREGLQFSLLPDPNRQIARAYDVLGPVGLVDKRVTFVIGRDGTVREAFHYELRAKRHIERVRALLRQQSESDAPRQGV